MKIERHSVKPTNKVAFLSESVINSIPVKVVVGVTLALTISLSVNSNEISTEKPLDKADNAHNKSMHHQLKTHLPEALFPQQPLVTHMYTADPSAHVFNGKLYIYPSHDIESGVVRNSSGGHFDMRDYHVFSIDEVNKGTQPKVIDHGQALHVDQVPWATKQMWAPDAAEKDGKYYLYFPAKDKDDIFRIGVATADTPTGPFVPEAEPIENAYSIDPSVFQDDDGSYYLYVGGIMGGQLQRWQTGSYIEEDKYPADNEPVYMPKIAKLNADMKSLAQPLQDVVLQDEFGKPILQGDFERKFFEAAWVHKIKDTYYFSYSTGHSRFIQYGTSKSPYGPFTWKGKVLEPVLGWTNHHSIAEFEGKWYLFFHDTSLSGGKTHLRNIKMVELIHNPDGTIQTVDAYLGEISE
ncbi:glycoside hydrolase family 43 protein [Pseudocolwellia agarivorans]|uniref:glycoside hydrolase family 43 protein n=1 Tax=Pseudocolwellia agarivorans TaxID=1911682 RepID=UPI003F882507